MTKSVLGVIGGSGIYDLPGLENVREQRIASPWGEPSGALRIGEIAGLPVVFLPRHDKGHRLSPSDINYRANIDVLKRAGVTDLDLAVGLRLVQGGTAARHASCWSISSSTAPTSARARSSARAWWRMSRWRIRCRRGCASISPRRRRRRTSRCVRDGTYVCMEGPQFSTLAESLTYKQLGYSVIGMTNMPEAKLAREAEICYATVAMVTDFDCWHPDHDAVTVQDIIKVLTANAEKAKRLVARLARDFPREHENCPIGSDRALDTALITAPEARDPELIRKLDAVAGRVLVARPAG